MPKKILRESLKEKRQNLKAEVALSEGFRVLRSLQNFQSYRHWLLYSPIQNEISTRPIFDWLQSQGATTYFPRIAGDQIEFFTIKTWEELKPARLAPEPDQNSEKFDQKFEAIILVPGLGFSKDGQRLGFGRGFYDRFLQTHSGIHRMGLAYDFQIILEPWAHEPHDEIMDFIATPSALWGSKRIL